MNLWRASLLFFLVTAFSQTPGLAQSPESTSFAGEWQIMSNNWVVVIKQEGTKLRGSWKESYREKDMTCSGLYFEGTISGSSVSGTRLTCGGRTQPLHLKIVDADTLEMTAFSQGGTGATYTYKRIK